MAFKPPIHKIAFSTTFQEQNPAPTILALCRSEVKVEDENRRMGQ
jgi:hypothetical protein